MQKKIKIPRNQHFVVFLEENDNCTARIIDNYGYELIDNCYTFDLYPGAFINVDNYEIVGQIQFKEKGLKYISELKRKIESGEIKQDEE